jgi:hypothetical protein
MATHSVRLVTSANGKYFVADSDGELIAESSHPINSAARYLLRRRFARPSDSIMAYLNGQFIMAGEIGWLAGASRD